MLKKTILLISNQPFAFRATFATDTSLKLCDLITDIDEKSSHNAKITIREEGPRRNIVNKMEGRTLSG